MHSRIRSGDLQKSRLPIRVSKIVLATLMVLVITASMGMDAFGQVSAQIEFGGQRELRFYTDQDSASGTVPMDGQYVWDGFSMRSDGPGDLLSPVLQVQSTIPPSTFNRWDPFTPTITQEDSTYLYTWSFDPSYPPSSWMPQVDMFSNLHTTQAVGYDSSRTVFPEVLDQVTTEQTVTVEVTPLEEFNSFPGGPTPFSVMISFPEEGQVSVQLVSYSSNTGVEPQVSTPDIPDQSLWWFFAPSVGTTYSFQAVVSVTNHMFPVSIRYKPGVYLEGFPTTSAISDTGSSISIVDPVLGTVTYSGGRIPLERQYRNVYAIQLQFRSLECGSNCFG